MFTPEELKALEEAGTHAADITEFVPIEAVDPIFFDKAYYLAPDKGGTKPYSLLAKALRESDRCAIGRWAARGKQYIVMIRPIADGNGDALVMQQLLYAAEVRAIKDIDIPKSDVKDVELKLAKQLIDQQASDKFDPLGLHGRRSRPRGGGGAEEGRGPGSHRRGRGARGRGAGHRPHGGAAREPREEGAGEGGGAAARRNAQAAPARPVRARSEKDCEEIGKPAAG
jgi:hypothetical protein